MGERSKLKIVILLLVIAMLIYGGLYIYSVSQVRVLNVNVNQLQDVSLKGFTLGGNVEIYNGGIIPVGISHLSYDVILENTGDELANGWINGRTISPGETIDYPLSTTINWVPSSQVALGLLSPGETYAQINGEVKILDLGFVDISLPFSDRINIEDYIRQFVKTKIQQVAQKVVTATKRGGQSIADAGSQFIKGVRNLFN